MATEKVAIAPEVTEGTNPGSGFVYYPFTSLDHDLEQTRLASRELRPDRNPPRSALVGQKVTRGFAFDVHLAVYNALLEGVFGSTFSTTINLTNKSINITGASGNTATLTDAAASGAFTNASKDQWIELGGFTNPVNNVWVRITTKTSNDVVIVEGAAFANESGQTDISIKGSMLRIGNTQKSFAIEKQFPDADATGLFSLSLGNIPSTFSMTAAIGALINGQIAYLGRTSASNPTTAAGSPAASAERDVLGPITGIAQIRVGDFGANSALRIQSVGFEWNNQVEQEEQLAAFGAQKASLGQVALTGTVRLYTKSTGIVALKQGAEAGTANKLSYRLIDSTGAAMIVTFPRISWNQIPSPVPGDTGPRLSDATFTVEPDDDSVAAQLDYFA